MKMHTQHVDTKKESKRGEEDEGIEKVRENEIHAQRDLWGTDISGSILSA